MSADREEGFYWIIQSEGCEPEVALWSADPRYWILIGDSYQTPSDDDFVKIGDRIYPDKTFAMTPERYAEYTRRPADGSMSEEEGQYYR